MSNSTKSNDGLYFCGSADIMIKTSKGNYTKLKSVWCKGWIK